MFSKENHIRISCEYEHVHVHSMPVSLSSTTFQEILSSVLEEMPWQTISVVHLMLVNILSSKGVVTPRKIMNQNFLCICVYTHFVFQLQCFTKFCWAVFEGLRWQKKTGQTDGSKALYPTTFVGYNNCVNVFNYRSFLPKIAKRSKHFT